MIRITRDRENETYFETPAATIHATCPQCQATIQFEQRVTMQALRLVDRDGSRRPIEVTSDGSHQVLQQQSHTDAGSPVGLPPEASLSLPEYFRTVVRPQLIAESKSKARLTEYDTAVRRWESAFSIDHPVESKIGCTPGDLEQRIYTPLLYQITPGTLESYRTRLLMASISPRQVDKNAATIVAILRRAHATWVIPRLPTIKSQTAPTTALLFTFDLDELSAIHAACEGAAWPMKTDRASGSRPVDAALYWRAFVIGGYLYGFRPQEWWRFDNRRSASQALSWNDINFDPEHEIHGRTKSNPHGWLRIFQTKTQRWVVLPMNEPMRVALLAIRDTMPKGFDTSQRVFCFPRSSGSKKGNQTVYPSSGFYSAWWDIVRRAGITPRIKTDERGRDTHETHAPKHFRKTARSHHQRRIGSSADWITGHLAKSVGERHYFDALPDVMRSIAETEMPEGF